MEQIEKPEKPQGPEPHVESAPPTAAVTQLLVRFSHGDKEALEKLVPEVYSELRRLAARYMRREKSNHTLQATALVHEAFFRLVDQRAVEWQSRAQFFGVAAQLMRRILIDHARQRRADKRGGGEAAVPFDEALHWVDPSGDGPDILALDEALHKLKEIDERQSRVVELRYFGGLNIEETAVVLGTSPATVKRDWTIARAWLFRELGDLPKDEAPASP